MNGYTLNLPPANLRIGRGNGVLKVYDPLRKKYVTMTPEENVRQHFVSWLVNNLHYPASLIANEIGINLNGTRKRCDTVVFKRDGSPLMIVEYKAPEVSLTQNVFDQIVRYNLCLRANYLVVSNGLRHYICSIDYATGSCNFLPSVPDYYEIRNTLNTD